MEGPIKAQQELSSPHTSQKGILSTRYLLRRLPPSPSIVIHSENRRPRRNSSRAMLAPRKVPPVLCATLETAGMLA